MISKVTFTPPTAGASAVTLHDPATTTTRYLSKIDGVVGPPAPRDVTRVLPGVDGIIDATQFVGERNITLEGELAGSSAGVSLSDLSTISEAFYASLLSPGKLEVTYENGTVRWCNAKLAGTVETSVEGNASLVQYQVQLRAADPRWYATTLKSTTLTLTGRYTSTSGTVTNSGTAPSPLTIAITANTAADLSVNSITTTVPSTYSSLVPNTYSTSGAQVIVSSVSATASAWTATAYGAGSVVSYLGFDWTASVPTASGDVPGTSSKWYANGSMIDVAATKVKTFTSSTRSGSYTGSGNALQGVAAASEFPFAYPGSNTFACVAAVTSTTGTNPYGTVVASWYDAYW